MPITAPLLPLFGVCTRVLGVQSGLCHVRGTVTELEPQRLGNLGSNYRREGGSHRGSLGCVTNGFTFTVLWLYKSSELIPSVQRLPKCLLG